MCMTALLLTRAFRKFYPYAGPCPLPSSPCSRRGKFGEDYFTLASTYFQGRPPKSVNFYWRRFSVADIPLGDQEKFDQWLHQRWCEKDALMEEYLSTGRFPASPIVPGSINGDVEAFVETEVRTKHWWEFVQIFVVLGAFGLLSNVLSKTWSRLIHMLG